jgi:hypothetical protein
MKFIDSLHSPFFLMLLIRNPAGRGTFSCLLSYTQIVTRLNFSKRTKVKESLKVHHYIYVSQISLFQWIFNKIGLLRLFEINFVKLRNENYIFMYFFASFW